jgi:hypothetical protein
MQTIRTILRQLITASGRYGMQEIRRKEPKVSTMVRTSTSAGWSDSFTRQDGERSLAVMVEPAPPEGCGVPASGIKLSAFERNGGKAV